jgi:hypothetical protein
MSLDYGAVLRRAWEITWNHKVLWLFGILAGLAGGANPNFNFQFDSRSPRPFDGLPPQVRRYFDQIDPNVLVAVVVGLICLGLLLVLVLIALSVIGRGGLIGGIRLAESQASVTFREAWAIGLRHFWTLFFIGLVVGLVTLAAFAITIVPGALFTAATFGLGALCLIPLTCLLAILAIILSIIAYFAMIAAVVEGLGVMAALSRAWEIIKANAGQIIVLGLIVIVISFIAGLIIGLPLLAIIVPVFVAVMGFATESTWTATTGLLIAGLCFLIYLPVLILLNGILQTWVTSVWTLAYQTFAGQAPRISAPPPAPAL